MRWLVKPPHWHLHFTPTHASWLNQVERLFASITNEAMRRGNFHSVGELKKPLINTSAPTTSSPNLFGGLQTPTPSWPKTLIYVMNFNDRTLAKLQPKSFQLAALQKNSWSIYISPARENRQECRVCCDCERGTGSGPGQCYTKGSSQRHMHAI